MDSSERNHIETLNLYDHDKFSILYTGTRISESDDWATVLMDCHFFSSTIRHEVRRGESPVEDKVERKGEEGKPK